MPPKPAKQPRQAWPPSAPRLAEAATAARAELASLAAAGGSGNLAIAPPSQALAFYGDRPFPAVAVAVAYCRLDAPSCCSSDSDAADGGDGGVLVHFRPLAAPPSAAEQELGLASLEEARAFVARELFEPGRCVELRL